MSAINQIRLLCLVSVSMCIFYYNYWSFGELWHSSEMISLLANFYSPAWFELPPWWQYLSLILWVSIYFIIFMGYTVFRHALLFIIVASFFINLSVEAVAITSVDMVVMDVWRLSDGALLYILYFRVAPVPQSEGRTDAG